MIALCNIKEIQIRHGSMNDLDLTFQAQGLSHEDADRVLDAFAEFKVRCMAPDPESPKNQPAPVPTCDEETGCAGCKENDLTDACERCSPPQSKTVAPPGPVTSSTAKIDPKVQSTPTKKSKLNPKTDKRFGRGNSYGIPSTLFNEDKTKYQRLWARCRKKGIKYPEALAMEGKAKPVGRHAKKAATNSAQIIRESSWSPEEDAAIRDCPTEDRALMHFMEKFPDSERPAKEVSARWGELMGATA